MYQIIQFCIENEKNKQIKYNTADQLVDMQAVNFVPVKRNWIFFLFWITKDRIFFYSITLYKINEDFSFSSNNKCSCVTIHIFKDAP